MGESLVTSIHRFTKLYSANTADVSITAPSVTATEPSGNGIVGPVAAGASLNGTILAFYAIGADNVTGTARVTGWRRIGDDATGLWIPLPLLALSFTAGTKVGVAAKDILNTERFADTIAVSTDYLGEGSYAISSGADNNIAFVRLDAFGCHHLQVQMAVGTATSVNGIASGY